MRQDHFSDSNNSVWFRSPTSILHLAQNKFELILRDHHLLNSSLCDTYLGFSAHLQSFDKNSCFVIAESSKGEEVRIKSQYLVATDGTSSSIRRSLGIQYEGKEKLQHLMNIHFKCKRLKDKLQRRPGMLYFVFNQVS